MPVKRSLFLVQGPNLTYLGKREPHLYGTTTAAQLDAIVTRHATARGAKLDILYTHSEGEAIGAIYEAVDAGAEGVVMNPAAFLFGAYGLRDTLRAIPIPYVEVHITNIDRRGFHSLLAETAVGCVHGFGVMSYKLGIDALLDHLDRTKPAPRAAKRTAKKKATAKKRGRA